MTNNYFPGYKQKNKKKLNQVKKAHEEARVPESTITRWAEAYNKVQTTGYIQNWKVRLDFNRKTFKSRQSSVKNKKKK